MPLVNRLLEHLELITQVVLVLGLAVFTWPELNAPRVPRPRDRWSRWQTNVILYALGALLMAGAFAPLSALAVRWGGLAGWHGLAGADWPAPVKVLVGVVLIDLYQYLLHAAAHHVPWWWRLHKIHHGDIHLDASTSVRHHPLEVLVNGFLLVLLLAATGVPVYAILAYGFLQQIHGLFCHANLAIPTRVDRWLRWFVVTPDMHAVHHSTRLDEGNSNFSMVFPWWDRLFGSYRALPQLGREGMRVGVAGGNPGVGTWGQLLWPFKADATAPAPTAASTAVSRKTRRKHKGG